MKILSSDRNSHIEIERMDSADFVNYSVSVEIGDFTARHDSIVLSDVTGFLDRLHQFERTRCGEVILEGGEDFELLIRALDEVGHLWIGIRIVRYTFLPTPWVGDELRFSGGFIFDPEFANQLFANLRGILRGTSQ
jgi:hypothetical protein